MDIEAYASTPLPEANVSIGAKLSGHKFYHYWRLMVCVFVVNGYFLYQSLVQNWWAGGSENLTAISNIAVGNIVMAVIIRQQYVVNMLFMIATSTPHFFPLKFRQLMGKVYHFGGLHLGGAIAGTVWMFLFCVALLLEGQRENSVVSSGTTVVTFQILLVLVLLCVMAKPTIRSRFHNHFEAVHRFGGWTALALFWLQLVLFIKDTNSGLRLSEALYQAPTFWALIVVTVSIALPWFRLQRVPIRIERPSDHVALVSFDYGVTPFAGSSTTISRSPLTEWHSFANVPSPGKTGFRLTVSRAGDWTGRLIDDMPPHVWVKGIPTAGVGNVDKLFKRVVWVCTGSGIGPALPHLLSKETPAHLVWSTRSARKTYGDKMVDEILDVEPHALIWDTDERGRPDLLQLAFAATKSFNAEAVIVIANEKLTRMVVEGMESRGIPAYGAIWDS